VKAVTPDGGIPENGLQLVIDQARNELKLSREIAPAEITTYPCSIKRRKN
jgi:hypothetical protein